MKPQAATRVVRREPICLHTGNAGASVTAPPPCRQRRSATEVRAQAPEVAVAAQPSIQALGSSMQVLLLFRRAPQSREGLCPGAAARSHDPAAEQRVFYALQVFGRVLELSQLGDE